MSQVPGPTQLSDALSNDHTIKQNSSTEDTLEVQVPRSDSPETVAIQAPEATMALEGSAPIGPPVEATLAASPEEIPPPSAETMVQGAEVTQAVGDPTVAIPRWAANTEVVTAIHQAQEGATVDLNQADRTTEFVEPSDRIPVRRPGTVRGAPTLPGYTILAEIGRGGMGVVYKAWHLRLDRPVALKMILSGAHASEEQLERFQIEAKALAQIQHPGIVQIHDIGEHDGLPFFSLEFVSGGSLDKKLARKPQPPDEAAQMVYKLAIAINHAHSLDKGKGIIHRDLKPANVLLTPEGEPKITDFGLAKRMEVDSQQTRSGAIMGTPSYMSPEQAWGQTHEIGKPTDQYALGTILYEMLVGHVPFQGATALETLELARTQEPIAPTRLQPKIPVDLETICLKCLQKEPSKRYPDVQTLAEELDRYLKGQPILARPIGRVERTVRWCRRNPKIAGLVAAVAVLLIAVSVGSTAFAFRLNTLNIELENSNLAEQEATKKAINAKNEAVTAKALAENAKNDAIKALKESQILATGMKQSRGMIDNLRSMSDLINRKLRQVDGTQQVREELVKESLKGIQNYVTIMESLAGILKDRDGDVLTKRTLAGIYQQAGRLMEDYERYDEAIKYFQMMDKLSDELVTLAPNDPIIVSNHAVIKATLGGFQLDRLGDGKAALDFFQKSLAIRRAILAKNPKDDGAKRGVCNLLDAVAKTYLKLGDPVKARDVFREEAQLREQFSDKTNAIVDVRREGAGLQEKLGDVSMDLNDFESARTAYKRTLELRQQIVEDHQDETQAKRDVLLSIRKLGTLDLFDGKPQQALEAYLEALEEFRKRLKADPTSYMTRTDMALTEGYVATAYRRLNKMDDARKHFQACLDIRLSLANDPRFKLNVIDVMIARAHCGQHAEAAKVARQLCEKPPLDSRIYYQAACGLSVCARSVIETAETPENQKLAREYAVDAVKALRLAKDAGWKNLGDLLNDPDLDPIRNDPGFVAILKEFRESTAR